MFGSKFKIFVSQVLLSFYSFIKVILVSKFRISLDKLVTGDDIVILGNGPSLKDSINNHSSFINNRIKLCVNFFPVSEYYEMLKPEIFVLSAPELWRENVEKIFKERGEELFSNISNKTSWKLHLLIPYEARKFDIWKSIVKKNKNIYISYYNNTSIEGISFISRILYRYNLGMPRPHNVLIPSLMISLGIGFNKIYLFGADHSWLKEISVNDGNIVLVNQKHFYDYDVSVAKTMLKARGGHRKLHEVLLKFVYSFEGYFEIRKYAEINNKTILNCTPNSFIDAFERKNIF